ncbi:2-phosphosulfolactate phosphatase [Rhodococcus rhodnii LMG 5362]|uniref:2-phosphosulfolactate phosphatase n=1 Tax=Rhodococcus rhodnii LMG 5362 TaxID=1273125 RepID=R7WH20_9NOCA|nr:2-phosphosulfolactate phosphatase [Rhodococcus rhodnii LMG 5362]
MNPAHQQLPYSVRFDWGLTGASAIDVDADVAVVVDVLSFSTTLSVAVDRGIEVFPYRWRDDGAAQHAA